MPISGAANRAEKAGVVGDAAVVLAVLSCILAIVEIASTGDVLSAATHVGYLWGSVILTTAISVLARKVAMWIYWSLFGG